MIVVGNKGNMVKTTPPGVVVPFYVYAAIAFLAGSSLLLLTPPGVHYFSPLTLAITHTMSLGWGTMIILGASHQLVPVLIEGRLFSSILAYLSFFLAAIGIPILVYAFYQFNMGFPAHAGAILVNAAVFVFLVNIAASVIRSKSESVHAVFVMTATVWLLITTLMGLLLVCNFTDNILPADSLHYLSFHAHIGIVGWFLLLIIGVGSRLIPMFLISKYDNNRLLWRIYVLINAGLIAFVLTFLYSGWPVMFVVAIACVLGGVILFGWYCYQCYKARLRKNVDEQMNVSLASVAMMAIPVIFLLVIFVLLASAVSNSRLVLLYGFTIFFGWITALILGMTFKTLPFIIWNRVYQATAGVGKTPTPKDLFSPKIFNGMAVCYLAGFAVFAAGVFVENRFLMAAGAGLLICCAFLYNLNVFKVVFHKRKKL